MKKLICILMAVVLPFAAFAADNLFGKVKDMVVIVQCDEKAGTGFVCEMGGRRYFVTNRHVVEGESRVAAYFVDGTELRFGAMEVAKGVDLVRFAVATNQPALSMREGEIVMHERVYVFGNSDGKEVFTDLPGTVEGIGADRLEVTSKFVHGNSGSAVIDAECRVVGVATYAIRENDPSDWTKKDTRFGDIRRFALRLSGREWEPSDLRRLKRQAEAKTKKEREAAGICPEAVATFKTPNVRINRSSRRGEIEYFVNGTIVLNLSGKRTLKNPVVRAAFLVECNGQRYAFDRFAVAPKGAYLKGDVPIHAYGMPSTGYSYEVGNGVYAVYLEGISYHQPSAPLRQMKDIEYFDRSMLTTGGFALPRELAARCDAANPPKVLAVRLECWQNGSLAGVYNSERPNTLNSRLIPVDWFVMNKYKRLFTYEAVRR